jgi:hypothetical protein
MYNAFMRRIETGAVIGMAAELLFSADTAVAQNPCTPVSSTRTDCGIFRLERPTPETENFVDIHINVERPKSLKNWQQTLEHGIGQGINYVEQHCGIGSQGGNETRLLGYLRVFLRENASTCLPFQGARGLVDEAKKVAVLNADRFSYIASRLPQTA